MITWATAGQPLSFRGKYPQDLPKYLTGFGLNGFEIQCGYGFNVSDTARDWFKSQGQITLSLHAPYFISMSSTEEEKRVKSLDMLLESAKIADSVGARRVVVHPGSCAKLSRETAMEYALESFKRSRDLLDRNGLEHIIICPETMGKINQLGTFGEVLTLCEFDERMLPCIDFGHLYSRNHGEVDYTAVFDGVEARLDRERMMGLHIHFSKQEFTKGGEKKHLSFENAGTFGPEYEPLLEEIAKRKASPFLVCESDGTQAEDCGKMAAYYNDIIKKENNT
ncbi:MAG: TIM barrel protein [Oscillospiraceae bacterium]|nr:TIM barrel protein [Oscillospiraceae bacterium]